MSIYDYANQDPVNSFDLAGTCSKSNAHSFSFSAFTHPACWYTALKDDASGGNGPVAQITFGLIFLRAGDRAQVEMPARIEAAQNRVLLSRAGRVILRPKTQASLARTGLKQGSFGWGTIASDMARAAARMKGHIH